MGYKQACQRLGVEAKELDPLQVPPVKPVSGFTPSDSVAPADKWAGKAGNFVTHCQQALLENKTACQWLAERGIDQKTAEKYRLGWNGKDFWRDRTAWGLPEELKPDGKPKKLWIPAGLVIPWSVAGRLHRLRIRRPEGEPRYYVVPGSGRSPMISRPDAAAYVVVESELDAILLDSLASDLVGIIAQGNSTAKPDQATWQPLQQAVSIMVALDTDEAGAKASVWWKQQLSTATRWPIVGGKDPGDAYKAGIDLRAWITAGLPPALKVKPAASCLQPATPPPAPPKATVTVATIAGHSIHITDDQATWRKLMDEGQTAYSNHELQRLAQAVQLADEHADHTKEIIMTAKEIFGGYILKTEALS
jgi:hypothetical protein